MKKEQRFGSWWHCLTCKDSPEMNFDQMKAHLVEVHKIDTSNTKAKKQLRMHLDGSDYFSSSYDVTINDVELVNNTCTKRDSDDPYWSDHQ